MSHIFTISSLSGTASGGLVIGLVISEMLVKSDDAERVTTAETVVGDADGVAGREDLGFSSTGSSLFSVLRLSM